MKHALKTSSEPLQWKMPRRHHARHSPLRQLFAQVVAPQYPFTPIRTETGAELAELYELDLANRFPGADVRQQAYAIARSSETRQRLEQSDALVQPLPGHATLRRKRRRGILRFLRTEAGQEGLPLFTPAPPPQPGPHQWPDVETRWGAYLDELEWEPYWIVRTQYGWRPTFTVMNSFAMRGVLWLRGSYYYYANANLLIPGRLLPETKYDTETVMRWVFREAYRLAQKW
jgi:hypothetical protein